MTERLTDVDDSQKGWGIGRAVGRTHWRARKETVGALRYVQTTFVCQGQEEGRDNEVRPGASSFPAVSIAVNFIQRGNGFLLKRGGFHLEEADFIRST